MKNSMPPPQIKMKPFAEAYADMEAAFSAKLVSDMTSDEFRDFTDVTCSAGLTAEKHQNRSILRLLAMNHVQMDRLISALNTENSIVAMQVKRLTIFGMILAGLQVVTAFWFLWLAYHPVANLDSNTNRIDHSSKPQQTKHDDEGSSVPKPLTE
jgi:hypothetical protein